MAFFGEGFTRRTSGVSLECGLHTGKIIEIKPVQNDYGKHLEIKLEVDGEPLTYPNTFRIYERPTTDMTTKAGKTFTAEQRQHMWDAEQTKFFDSFHIPTEPNPFQNFKSWVGKSGVITVQVQKSNPDYREILPYEKKQQNKPESEPKPAPVENTPTTGADGFSEDIPF